MQSPPLEIVIPIYNEGQNIIKLFDLFAKLVKTKFRILLCYDNEDDDIFKFATWRLKHGLRWWEDVLRNMKHDDYNIIPTRMLLKYEDRWVEKGVENG